MKRILVATAAVVMLTASVSSAQNTTRRSSGSRSPEPRMEFIPMGGYAWTLGMDVIVNGFPGELDFTDTAYYGAALDFNVTPPGAYKKGQVRLLYRRSDANVEISGLADRFETDAAIEYWHIGGVTGMVKGKSMPFATVSLGGTRLSAGDEDSWKFSMIFGLGVKVYTSPKLGIMIQGNWPITFTDTWGGVTVGTGGAGVGIGGTGISQLDVGGGLILRF